MPDRDAETKVLTECGDPEDRRRLIGEIFTRHRDRLRAMVNLRLDPRLKGRLDPSDVLQEVFIEILARLDDYLKHPALPLFLWLRRMTGQKLFDLHRHHLGARARDKRREVSLHPGAYALT